MIEPNLTRSPGRPVDSQHLDSQPLDSQHLDNQHLDSQHLDSQHLDNQPLDSQPLDSQPLDSQRLDNQPLDNQSIDNQPIDTRPGSGADGSVQPDPISWPPALVQCRHQNWPKRGAMPPDISTADPREFQACRGSDKMRPFLIGNTGLPDAPRET